MPTATASFALRLLDRAAGLLTAKGLIVWLWDAHAAALEPKLASGYSSAMLARLPALTLASDSMTVAVFRSGQTAFAAGDRGGAGALVVPLQIPGGCSGVLALELESSVGRDSRTIEPIRAVAAIVAALLAQLVGGQTASAGDDLHDDLRSRESA